MLEFQNESKSKFFKDHMTNCRVRSKLIRTGKLLPDFFNFVKIDNTARLIETITTIVWALGVPCNRSI